MASTLSSIKHKKIDDTNTIMVVSVAITAALIAFSIVSIRSMMNIRSYQSRVISAQEESNKNIEENVQNLKKLVESYKSFDDSSTTVISTVSGQDVQTKNATLILDALPSKYDFPALLTTLDLLNVQTDSRYLGGYSVSYSSTDSEIGATQSSTTPEAIKMSILANVDGESGQLNPTRITGVQSYLINLSRMIRPINIKRVSIESSLSSNIEAGSIVMESYYQPEKLFTTSTKVVQ